MGPLALLLITLLTSCNYALVCNNNYECQLEVISDTYVYCYGYFSCFQAPSIASTPGWVSCEGSHSCYEVTTITAQLNTICHGLYSCAFLQNMNSAAIAYGGYSMYGIMNDNTINLSIYGYLACYNSTHNVDRNVKAYGALALQNSYINITRIWPISPTTINFVYLYSYLALYDGELHCESGTQCIMKCLGGNACENVRFTCVGRICDVDCRFSTKNALCPNGLHADWLEDIKYENLFANESNLNKYNWTFSTYENSYQTCNTPNAINCDDYRDTRCYQKGIFNWNGPICCTGSEACTQTYIEVYDPNINSTDDVAIRCDSSYACRYGNIATGYGGNIYCSGNYACHYAKIYAIENTNIFCEGSLSCYESSIYDAKNLLCTGYEACYNANIYHLAGNVYGLAIRSLYSTLMHNIAGNIYCLAYWGAINTIIDGVHNIYGNSYQCFYSSQISNVNNLYLVGESILAYSTVTNVDSIYVSGTNSVANSKIENFRNIEIFGNTSLSNSILISGNYIHTQNNYQTEVNISIYDNYYSLPSQIYCNSSDTCNVLCLSPYACQQLHLYCDGQCYVSCDASNGISCPLTVTSKYPTTGPSDSPTLYPSDSPTLYPSVNVIPTKSPTLNPKPTKTHTLKLTHHSLSPTNNPSAISVPIKTHGFIGYSFPIIIIGGYIDFVIFIYCIYYIFTQLIERTHEPYNAAWIDTIKQFECMDYIGIIFELFDIITDYAFAAHLIVSPSTELLMHTLGWISLFIGILGTVTFLSKYMLLKKLLGIQIKKYRHKLKQTNDVNKRNQIMHEILIRKMDISILSLFNSSIEGIPQTLIVLVYLRSAFDYISIASLSMSMFSFLLKLQIALMNKCGCNDVNDVVNVKEQIEI